MALHQEKNIFFGIKILNYRQWIAIYLRYCVYFCIFYFLVCFELILFALAFLYNSKQTFNKYKFVHSIFFSTIMMRFNGQSFVLSCYFQVQENIALTTKRRVQPMIQNYIRWSPAVYKEDKHYSSANRLYCYATGESANKESQK